jgi:3-(3-hydroxy-phenyl)propionate hydroxylase
MQGGAQPHITYTSVVIVGAGPTGLTAGNLLGLAGIDTLILERNATLSDYPKAIAIDDEGLRICQAMGLSNEMMENLLQDVEAHFCSQQRFLARIAPTSRRNGYPLISTFDQPTFEVILLGGLKRFKCVRTLFQHLVESVEQDEQAVRLSVRTPGGSLLQVECAYLLACDGGKSPIRHALGIPMRPPTLFPSRFSRRNDATTSLPSNSKRDEGQRWLVVDCINDDDDSTVGTCFCDYRRPTVTVPAPHHARRWEFMLLPTDSEEDLLRPEYIPGLIQQAQQSHPNNKARETVPNVIRQAIYTFRAAIATRFSKGRVFLLGDAAHLMPPFGGQGMNSGLRDAHNLCWKIAMVLQEQAEPHLLETYHEERYSHAAQMVLLSSLLGKAIMPTNRLTAFFRDLFFLGLNTLPPMREALTEMRIKPQPRYPRGFLLPVSSKENKAFRGMMLPQPHVLTSKGEHILLDDVLGSGFALLRLYENPSEAFTQLRGELWERLGVRFVCVPPCDYFDPNSHLHLQKDTRFSIVIDIEQQMSMFFRNNRDLCLLVRPDRYIFGAFRTEEADSIVTNIQKMLE